MNFTPQQIDQMSVWQFFAALDGWIAANSSGDGLSENEKDELWAWLQEQPEGPIKWMH